jgi:hypothetical protein
MLTKPLINEYLEAIPVEESTKSLKRTRASTRKFVEQNKIIFKKILTKNDVQIAFYELNGRKHQIKVRKEEEIEKIIEISCNECKGKE